MTTTRIARLLCALSLVACSSINDGAVPRAITPTIILSNESRSSTPPPSGPAVSVLDSVELRITPENGEAIAPLGRHLFRYNSTATLQPSFPPGNVTFAADVFSIGHVSVFSGSVSQLITSDVLSVVLRVTATRPVLLMVPDTSKTSTITNTQFTVYNAGVGSLDWSIATIDTAFTRCGSPCAITPTSGSVAPGATATLRASVPTNFPSRNFAFVIRSAEGNVTVNWQYSTSAITSVAIQPTASLHNIGQAFTLTPTVVATGTPSTAVSWSSSSPSVATVNGTGSVTGASRGIATVTATSVVDTSKKATADIRVYDSTATSATWAMAQSAVPDTVRRDDTSPGARSTLALIAQATGTLATGAAPFSAVEFWVRAGSVGPWKRVGQATTPTVGTDASGGRMLSWSYTWNPDATDAPFINPSTTGMSVIAIGITPAGVTTATSVNHDVFVRVP